MDREQILLFGEINDETGKTVIDALLTAKPPIDLYICSPGGLFEIALAIIDLIAVKDVRVIGLGHVYSSAGFIYCSCKNRSSFPNTVFNFHPFYYSLDQDFVDRQLAFSKFAAKNLADTCLYIDTVLKWSPGQFLKFIKKDSWLDVNQAIKLGIVGDVV